MPDTDKTLWRHMHKETTDEFHTGQGHLFPSAIIAVVFHMESDIAFIHTDEAVIADGNTMCVFSKITDHRLGTIESLLQ